MTPNSALSPPQYVLWELTLACNLRCRHCLTSSGAAAADELSTSEALKLCDELADLGVPAVALMGGEPLMRPDWEAIATRLWSHRIPTGLVTNGVAFDTATAQRALGAGVNQIVVSLDGGRQVHEAVRGRGTFDKALDALRVAQTIGFRHRMVVTSLHKGNLKELVALRDLLVESAQGAMWALNTTSIRAGQRMSIGQRIDARDFIEIADFISRTRRQCAGVLDVMGAHDIGYHSVTLPDVQGCLWTGCKAGLSTMGITATGGIKGCLVLPNTCVEGNVREGSIAELWRNPEAFAYNRKFVPDQLAGRCRACVHGPSCRGGCMEHALTRMGHAHEAPFCLHRGESQGEP